MDEVEFYYIQLNKKNPYKLCKIKKRNSFKSCYTQERCKHHTSNIICNSLIKNKHIRNTVRKWLNETIFGVGSNSQLRKLLKRLQRNPYMYSYVAQAVTTAVSTIALAAAETATTIHEHLKFVYDSSHAHNDNLHNNTIILTTSSSSPSSHNSDSAEYAISFGNLTDTFEIDASSSSASFSAAQSPASTFATNASTPSAPLIEVGVNVSLTSTDDWSHFYDLILSWQGICLIAVFCAFIVITIIGNTLVILAVITTRRLKTVTNCFVMSLAVADLLVGIFVMPPAVAVHLIGSWQLGWVLCDIWISLDVLLCTASILSLCAISVDRYLAVTQPLTYSRKRRSKRLALIMILIVWTLALAITCPPILGWYEPGRRDLNECRYNQNEGYVIFSAMGSFFIPMAVMIYVYARISCVIANRHDNMTDISVHNKKFKRYTASDIDNELDPDLAEFYLSSGQKKQQAARTLSNQTLAKDLQEIVASDNKIGHAAQCHSLLALQQTATSPTNKSVCYEMKRPSSLKRSPTASSVMTTTTSTTGGTAIVTSGIGMENPWTFSAGSQQLPPHYPQHAHPNKQMRTCLTGRQHSSGNSLTSEPIATGSGSSILRPHTPQLRSHHHQHSHPHSNKSLSNRISSLKKETKTTQTLSIVVGGFIACWLPFFINYLITPFLDEDQVSSTLAKVLTWLGWMNSAINPFIYAFYSVDFRAAFWRLTCQRFFSASSKPQFTTNTMSIRR